MIRAKSGLEKRSRMRLKNVESFERCLFNNIMQSRSIICIQLLHIQLLLLLLYYYLIKVIIIIIIDTNLLDVMFIKLFGYTTSYQIILKT